MKKKKNPKSDLGCEQIFLKYTDIKHLYIYIYRQCNTCKCMHANLMTKKNKRKGTKSMISKSKF